MVELALFCKSYRPDLDRCSALVGSLLPRNRSELPFYLCVPAAERIHFANRLGTDGIRYLADEEILGREVPQSWRTQQLVKLGFAGLEVCQNYLWIDSDFVILRDFWAEEFFAYSATPYTVMFEADTDLFRERLLGAPGDDPEYSRMLASVLRASGLVRDWFGRRGPLFFYGAPAIWSSLVVQALSARMKEAGLDFEKMLEIAPFELTWYGEFLLSTQFIPVVPRGSLAVYFARDEHYRRFRESGLTLEACAARGYLAANFAAKWMQNPPWP